MKTIISVIGSNATGKSTRINNLVDYLDILEIPYQEMVYSFHKNKIYRTISTGRKYENGVFILGKKTKGGGWVGADDVLGKLGDKASIYGFLEETLKSSSIIVIEGYFAVGGAGMRPQALRDNLNYKLSCNQYYFLYHDLEEYVKRTESRSGRTWESRGKNPEESSGWKSNVSYWKGIDKAKEQSKDSDTVTWVSPYADEDFFINLYKDDFYRKWL